MRKVIIDTNGFVRLFIQDIPQQAAQVEKLLQHAKDNKIQIRLPYIIFFEINFTLSKFYHIDKYELIDKLESIVSSPYIKVQSRQVLRVALKRYRSTNISLVDCFLLAQVQEKGVELFTFDHELKKLSQ